MATDQLFINRQDVQTAPFQYQLSGIEEMLLQAVTATFDGTGAGGSFLPALQIIGPGGVTGPTFVDKDNAVAAGDSAEVTFGTFLSRPTAAPPTPCNPYVSLLQLLGVDAVWVLDETVGSVAHDSSGNGHDISATTTDPTWDAWISPPGTDGAHLASGQSLGGAGAGHTYSPNLSGDFTYLVWCKPSQPGSNQVTLLGSQGNPTGVHKGWSFGPGGPGRPTPNSLELTVGTGVTTASIVSDSTITWDTQQLLGFRYLAGTFTLWVNGVQQTATYSGAFSHQVANVIVGPPRGTGAYMAYASLFAVGVSDAGMELLYTNP